MEHAKSSKKTQIHKSSEAHKTPNIAVLIITLVTVLLGGVLFIGAVGGWFGETKVTLDTEYYSDAPTFIDIDGVKYDELAKDQKSFIVFVDQNGCTAADKLREYAKTYSTEKGIDIYRIMFSDAKDSSLHDHVKYYPSLVLVNKGKVHTFLRADSDDDAKMYNDYDAFKSWLDRYL